MHRSCSLGSIMGYFIIPYLYGETRFIDCLGPRITPNDLLAVDQSVIQVHNYNKVALSLKSRRRHVVNTSKNGGFSSASLTLCGYLGSFKIFFLFFFVRERRCVIVRARSWLGEVTER